MVTSTHELPTAPNIFSAACITRTILSGIADKWTILVISALAERPYYFGELRRKLDGISQKMLTQTLRRLERDGLINREVHQRSIVRVRYSLTPIGEELTGPLENLQQWIIRNASNMQRTLADAC